jgi:hypothetical protein
MVRLAAIVEAWTRSRTGVSPHTAAAIDAIYREQYQKVSNGEDRLDGHNYNNQT